MKDQDLKWMLLFLQSQVRNDMLTQTAVHTPSNAYANARHCFIAPTRIQKLGNSRTHSVAIYGKHVHQRGQAYRRYWKHRFIWTTPVLSRTIDFRILFLFMHWRKTVKKFGRRVDVWIQVISCARRSKVEDWKRETTPTVSPFFRY